MNGENELEPKYPCQNKMFAIRFKKPDGTEQESQMAVCSKLKEATNGMCPAILPVAFCDQCKTVKEIELNSHVVTCMESVLRNPRFDKLPEAASFLLEKVGREYMEFLLLQMASSGMYEESVITECVKACQFDNKE